MGSCGTVSLQQVPYAAPIIIAHGRIVERTCAGFGVSLEAANSVYRGANATPVVVTSPHSDDDAAENLLYTETNAETADDDGTSDA
jgi:hypothetical protein